MGRPVKKDINGTIVFGDYTTSAAGIRVTAYFGGSSRDDVYIVAQKGSRRYKVKDKSDNATAICKLISGTPSANGEMKLLGYTDAGADVSVAIRQLFKRTAIDFSGNRYKWVLVNDSSMDYIQLTAI